MATYRDIVARISMPMLRARYTPRAFRQFSAVTLEHAGHVATIEIVQVASPTCRGGVKRVFACPRCARRCFVVGCAPTMGWGCSGCLQWRGRNGRTRQGEMQTLARRSSGRLPA